MTRKLEIIWKYEFRSTHSSSVVAASLVCGTRLAWWDNSCFHCHERPTNPELGTNRASTRKQLLSNFANFDHDLTRSFRIWSDTFFMTESATMYWKQHLHAGTQNAAWCHVGFSLLFSWNDFLSMYDTCGHSKWPLAQDTVWSRCPELEALF